MGNVSCIERVNTLHAAFAIHTQIFGFSKLSKLSEISKPITDMFVLQCISHGDFKYSHQIPVFCDIFQNFMTFYIFTRCLLMPTAWEVLISK